jgi:hypothetical protein
MILIRISGRGIRYGFEGIKDEVGSKKTERAVVFCVALWNIDFQ